MRRFAAAPALLAAVALAGSAQARLRQFSYDPANDETRQAAGGVTFLIDQTLLGVKVLELRATAAKASAHLKRADGADLGPGGVDRALGRAGPEHQLFRITDADQGPELVAALCRGSRHGWLALTPVRFGADLQAIVIGDDPKGGPPHVCRTLDFDFHGEWSVPPSTQLQFDDIAPPDFPN